MLKPPSSWVTTLRKLGFVYKKRSVQKARQSRLLKIESLEPRQLLSGTQLAAACPAGRNSQQGNEIKR